MTAEVKQDLEVIVPHEGKTTIDGVPVRVQRMRLRETMALARIVSTGLGAGVFDLAVTNPDDVDQFKADILGYLVVALPNAIEETLQFFATIVEPVNKKDAGKLKDSFGNPDLGDLLSVLEIVMEQEGDNLFDILGKAQKIGGSLTKLLQDRRPKTEPKQETPADG